MLFDKKAKIMQIIETSPRFFEWQPMKNIWINYTRETKLNVFSRVGIGASTITIHFRKTKGFSLFNAIEYKGRIHFVSSITEVEPLIYKVLAVDISPNQYTAEIVHHDVDENLEPQFSTEPVPITFPAMITEKYLGYQQENPMVELQKNFVLITPKQVVLKESDLVMKDENKYTVAVCHVLDEFKNEYEILKVGDESGFS